MNKKDEKEVKYVSLGRRGRKMGGVERVWGWVGEWKKKVEIFYLSLQWEKSKIFFNKLSQRNWLIVGEGEAKG